LRYRAVQTTNAPDGGKTRQKKVLPGSLTKSFAIRPAKLKISRPAATMPDKNLTILLQNLGRDDGRASNELLPLVYEELRRLAAARMQQEMAGHTLQPTALVHEAWMRMVGEGDRTWKNRAHFFAAAAECMRRILIESARRKSRLKRGGGQVRLNIDDLELSAASADDKILLIDEAVARLEKDDPEKARVVVMKFFGGMTNQEIAEHLGVTERTVERHWAYARACLFKIIRTEM
jgi:RNA polymerase sigma factor (TIGR02999 family)